MSRRGGANPDAGVAERPDADTDPTYWDGIALEWNSLGAAPAWRTLSDEVNARLIDRWLAGASRRHVLKTDLFDELAGAGLVDRLRGLYQDVSGIDLSPEVVMAVSRRYPGLDLHTADVRTLPFSDSSFDAVVSNSTLDHFESKVDILLSLREIRRVLRAGGSLLVTLDNEANPIVAVRNALPASLRQRTSLVPYAVGATCRGPRELRALLVSAGFDVVQLSAVLHCPRVLCVPVGSLIDRLASERLRSSFVGALAAFEHLERLPSRFVTGHFVAALARKPTAP